MNLLSDINSVITALLCGSVLMLSFLILSNPKKVNLKANVWFGFFLISVFFVLLEDLALILNVKVDNKVFFEILNISSFILPPLFYFSVVYFISPNRIWVAKDFCHFLFCGIFIVLTIFSYIFPLKYQLKPNSIFATVISFLFLGLFCLQIIMYGLLSIRLLINHQKNIKSFSSNLEGIDLKWLFYIVYGICFLFFLWLIHILFEVSEKNFSLINFLLFIGIFFIGYFAIQQKEIFPFSVIEIQEINTILVNDKTAELPKKKLIDDDQLEILKTQLIQLMNIEKLFLDPELSLIKLSNKLNLSTHTLSYLINNGFNENFYQFVNRYRVEEAKKLLNDKAMNHLSLIGIAYEVGFNSKTVFNTVFKKNTGLTPKEYKNQ